MAYEWTNGELITAEKLNQTGGGSPLTVRVEMANGVARLSETAQTIIDAMDAGQTVCVIDPGIILGNSASRGFVSAYQVHNTTNGGRVDVTLDAIFYFESVDEYPTIPND